MTWVHTIVQMNACFMAIARDPTESSFFFPLYTKGLKDIS